MNEDDFDIDETRTLSEARATFQSGLDDGTFCPCCGRFDKRYKRKLNSGMARDLIRLYRWSLDNGFDVWASMEAVAPHGELSKLRWWSLVSVDPSKPNECCITENGCLFVQRKRQVLQRAIILHNECEGFVEGDDEWITIDDALGDRFDYWELMRD